MSSILWLPDALEDLLLVTIDPKEATNSEWEMMLLLNQAACDWVRGKLNTGTYQDILEAAGFDPIEFLAIAERHVELLIKNS